LKAERAPLRIDISPQRRSNARKLDGTSSQFHGLFFGLFKAAFWCYASLPPTGDGWRFLLIRSEAVM
jgi:hypothetical protein